MKIFKWFRKYKGGVWYKHEFTLDSMDISIIPFQTFWARYGELNRYTKVIKTEEWK